MNRIKKSFVDNVREVWQHWSLRLGAIGTAFVTWFMTSPETAIAAWAMLPDDLKSVLPPQIVGFFGVSLFVLSLVVKFIKQPNLPSNKQ